MRYNPSAIARAVYAIAVLASAAALHGCTPEPTLIPPDSSALGQDGNGLGDSGDSSGLPGDASETGQAQDAASDLGDDTTAAADAASSCSGDGDCSASGALTSCEYARCISGKCQTFKALDGKPCGDAECLSEGALLTLKARVCTAGVCGAQIVSNSCDDGDACTQELCNASAGCGHTPVACSDGDSCTQDTCSKTIGCVYLPLDGSPCDDGNACTSADLCTSGKCSPGQEKACPSANACVVPKCEPASGACLAVNVADGSGCDDGNPCSASDACQTGVCTGKDNPCDDANPCTFDGCSGGNCQHIAAPGPCDLDGSKCSADACDNGTCKAGASLDCNDGNPCSVDACSAKGGCTHAPAVFASPCEANKWCGQGAQASSCVPVSVPAGMAWVNGGPVTLGCAAGDSQCNPDEKPAHSVQVSSFFIDLREVTVEQYQKCVSGGACTQPGSGVGATWGAAGKTKHPVNYLTWSQASAYCLWSGSGRLCTEAEWEMAARGADQRRYPWGNSAGNICEFANWGGNCGGIQPVGQFPKGDSPCGAQDMAGNLREWTADWYGASYYADLAAQSTLSVAPSGPQSGPGRVVRGGYFLDNAPEIRTSARAFAPPASSAQGIGARCCRSPK